MVWSTQGLLPKIQYAKCTFQLPQPENRVIGSRDMTAALKLNGRGLYDGPA